MVLVNDGIILYCHPRRAEAAVNLVELAQESRYKVNRMAASLRLSPRQLERDFQNALGVSPKYWMRLQRMIRARQLIRCGVALKAVALELGFAKYDKFALELREFYNLSPLEMVHRERTLCYDIVYTKELESRGPATEYGSVAHG